jgi:cytochrome c-type biogenesis protein CcmH
MLVLCLSLVLPPLLKHQRLAPAARDLVNAAIYKDQLNELEADLKTGILSQEQYEQARHDLERNLLTDASPDNAVAPADRPGSARSTAIVMAITLPVLAISLYLQLGQGRQHPDSAPELAVESATGMPDPEVMVQRLAERMKSTPQDGAGWLMLGRSYTALGRFPEASAAYGKAIPLVPADAQLLADYAEALALSKPDQDLAGQPAELAQQALALNSKNQKALWIAGMAAYQQGQLNAALGYWKPLSAVLPPESEDAVMVKKLITEAEATLGE